MPVAAGSTRVVDRYSWTESVRQMIEIFKRGCLLGSLVRFGLRQEGITLPGAKRLMGGSNNARMICKTYLYGQICILSDRSITLRSLLSSAPVTATYVPSFTPALNTPDDPLNMQVPRQ